MLPHLVFMDWFDREKESLLEDLCRLIATNTVVPNEGNILPIIEPLLTAAGLVVRAEPAHSHLTAHPAYTPHRLSMMTQERMNLRTRLSSSSSRPARRALFSCHLDVVPAADFPDAFHPSIHDNAVYGRGACDNKGNLIALLGALRFIGVAGLPLRRDVLLDLVIEEEVGGNGALSTIMHGVEADEVIVLEPTGLRIFRGHRGCVTFSVEVHGIPVHMGADATGASAIDIAYRVIEQLRALESEFLFEAKSDPEFRCWNRPIQLNVGRIAGGEWPGAVPSCCVVEGNLGFLPRYTVRHVMGIIESRLAAMPLQGISHLEVSYPGVRAEGYVCPSTAEVVQDMCQAVTAAGCEQTETFAWNVSCDARLYATLLGLPTIIFGAGELQDAHSNHEHLAIPELARAMYALTHFLTGPSSE